MRITTQEEFEKLFSSGSMILNRLPIDPRKPPRFMQAYDFSRRGLDAMLKERVGPSGSLEFYREGVKSSLQAWKVYSSRQVRKLPAPVGVWAEAINKGRARVKVCERECRELNRLLDIEKAKEAAQTKAIHKHPTGTVKMKGGIAHSCDGRRLIVDSEGVAKFEDNGELLETYLDALKASNRAASMAKHAENAATEERVRIARKPLKT